MGRHRGRPALDVDIGYGREPFHLPCAREELRMIDNPEQDFVLQTVKTRDVHFVRLWFTDVLGNMKSFA